MHLKERKPVTQNARKRMCTALPLVNAFRSGFLDFICRVGNETESGCRGTCGRSSAQSAHRPAAGCHSEAWAVHSTASPLQSLRPTQTTARIHNPSDCAVSTLKGRKVKLKRKNSLFIDTQTANAKLSSCQCKSQIEQICYAGF